MPNPPSPKTVRLCFVGCGAWAKKKYLPDWRRMSPEVEVVGFAQILTKPEKEQILGIFPQTKFFDSSDELFATIEVDGGIVSLPHSLIFPALSSALTHHIPVMTDKPFTTSATEGVHILKLAKGSDTVIGVCHQRRYYPGVVALHAAVHETPQRPRWIAARFLIDSYPHWRTSWRNDPIYSGSTGYRQGILLDAGYHLIDAVLYLMDFELPQEVFCSAGYHDAQVETDAVVTLVFRDGTTATLLISRGMPAGVEEESIEVLTDLGYASSRIAVRKGERTKDIDITTHRIGETTHGTFSTDDCPMQPVRAFIKHLQGEPFPEIWSAESALPTMKVLDALYESLVSGKVVTIQ